MEYRKAIEIVEEVIRFYKLQVWGGIEGGLPRTPIIMDDGTKITEALIDEAFNKVRNG